MTLRVGILGAGIMGQAHAQAYLEVGAIINGVVDINQTTAIALADRFGCAAYTSAKDLLKEDIDAVSICLPHNLHLDAALQVASHGKHILMEKPLAITLAGSKSYHKCLRDSQCTVDGRFYYAVFYYLARTALTYRRRLFW